MGKIRLATAALSGRIFAGYPNKAGDGFRGERHDVTGDVLKTIAEHLGMNKTSTVYVDGEPKYTITIIEGESGLSPGMRRLVLAAREAAFNDHIHDEEVRRELDEASESFAELVPWEDEPDQSDEAGEAARAVG